MLTLHKYGKNHLISFELANYLFNKNLYVGMICHEETYSEPWSHLTVNLDVPCGSNRAFIDINNNGNEIINWLEQNNLGHCTGNIMPSGWCIYPEFEFNMDELMKYVISDERKFA